MFRSQPQTQPHRRVTVYSAIGRTDGSKTEVVRPSAHCAVELRHYCYWIQRGCTPSGHFAYFPTDALHPLSRWNGAKIPDLCPDCARSDVDFHAHRFPQPELPATS